MKTEFNSLIKRVVKVNGKETNNSESNSSEKQFCVRIFAAMMCNNWITEVREEIKIVLWISEELTHCILFSIIEHWTESELAQSSSVKERNRVVSPWQFASCLKKSMWFFQPCVFFVQTMTTTMMIVKKTEKLLLTLPSPIHRQESPWQPKLARNESEVPTRLRLKTRTFLLYRYVCSFLSCLTYQEAVWLSG